MPFYKIPMNNSDEYVAPYPFVVAEGDCDEEALECVLAYLPTSFGEGNDEGPIEVVTKAQATTSEWPFFSRQFFEREIQLALDEA